MTSDTVAVLHSLRTLHIPNYDQSIKKKKSSRPSNNAFSILIHNFLTQHLNTDPFPIETQRPTRTISNVMKAQRVLGGPSPIEFVSAEYNGPDWSTIEGGGVILDRQWTHNGHVRPPWGLMRRSQGHRLGNRPSE